MRIVTLLPSATEIVAALGLADRLVGVTHECDHPAEAVAGRRRVTVAPFDAAALTQHEIDKQVSASVHAGASLYRLDEAALAELRPTHVLTQSLCEVCAVAHAVVVETMRRLFPDAPPAIVDLDPTNLDEVLRTIEIVGLECGVEDRAEAYVAELRADLDRVRFAVPCDVKRPRVAFLEWVEPLFHGGHWVPEMVTLAGGHDVLGMPGEASGRDTIERLVQTAPEVIVVAPCGFDPERAARDVEPLWKQPWWCGLPAVKHDRVYAVDANAYFSRPGPRLVQGTAILARLFHGVDVGLVPEGSWRRVTPSERLPTPMFDAEGGR